MVLSFRVYQNFTATTITHAVRFQSGSKENSRRRLLGYFVRAHDVIIATVFCRFNVIAIIMIKTHRTTLFRELFAIAIRGAKVRAGRRVATPLASARGLWRSRVRWFRALTAPLPSPRCATRPPGGKNIK